MKTTAHTPTPWTADPIYLGDSPRIVAHRLFRPDCGGSFATIEHRSVTGKRLSNAEAAANAAFIARACNAYGDLLIALQALVDCQEETVRAAFNMRYDRACQCARDTIAKAKTP